MSNETITILVADDEPDIRDLVAFRLQRAGHNVLLARDGQEALALIQEHRPTLALLDIRMPKMTGLEVVRALRADPETEGMLIVLLTASVREDAVEIGFEAGADDYIKKPFSPAELNARIQALLGRRR
jgi:DNA-binding response OmpR family regulator